MPVVDGEARLWRSELLGERREVGLPQGRVEYFLRGSGPTLVLSHGWLANANLWRDVVDRLADRFTCVALDLPFGSHRVPMDPAADLSPPGVGELLAAILDELDLRDVTLVGNDSGGAYSQIAAAAHPERVAALALNSCETPYDEWPPPPFDGLPALVQDAQMLKNAFELLRDPELRWSDPAFGLVIKHRVEDRVMESYCLPVLHDDGIVEDTRKVMSSTTAAPLHEAARRLIESFEGPVLLAWPSEDRVFPIEHAHRYASELRDARVEPIGDSYSFTPEDQPAALADAIARFASR